MPPVINLEKCDGCARCDVACPGDVIYYDRADKKPVVKYPKECWHCGACRLDCPTGAISFVFPLEMVIGDARKGEA